jgi:hypothetical protein
MIIPICFSIHHLVGGFNPSEKILVSWDDYSQYMENKSHVLNHHFFPFSDAASSGLDCCPSWAIMYLKWPKRPVESQAAYRRKGENRSPLSAF